MTGPDPLLEGIAHHLDTLGHGAYRVGTPVPAGDTVIVLFDVPARPAELLTITPYQVQTEPDYLGRWSEPWVQFRVRDSDPDRAARRARALFDDLHGVGHLTLPGGVEVMSIIAVQQGPISMGRDTAGLHEWSCNVRIDHLDPVAHHP